MKQDLNRVFAFFNLQYVVYDLSCLHFPVTVCQPVSSSFLDIFVQIFFCQDRLVVDCIVLFVCFVRHSHRNELLSYSLSSTFFLYMASVSGAAAEEEFRIDSIPER